LLPHKRSQSPLVGHIRLPRAENITPTGEPDAFFVLLRALVDGMVSLYGLAVGQRAAVVI
jgi:hypothetical protein